MVKPWVFRRTRDAETWRRYSHSAFHKKFPFTVIESWPTFVFLAFSACYFSAYKSRFRICDHIIISFAGNIHVRVRLQVCKRSHSWRKEAADCRAIPDLVQPSQVCKLLAGNFHSSLCKFLYRKPLQQTWILLTTQTEPAEKAINRTSRFLMT